MIRGCCVVANGTSTGDREPPIPDGALAREWTPTLRNALRAGPACWDFGRDGRLLVQRSVKDRRVLDENVRCRDPKGLTPAACSAILGRIFSKALVSDRADSRAPDTTRKCVKRQPLSYPSPNPLTEHVAI
jgi:hypothetical protein